MHFSYTKKIGGLDYKVWITLVIVSFLSLGVIGFKSVVKSKCPSFRVMATGSLQHANNRGHLFYVQEVISFTLMPNVQGNPKWDFGDLSPAVYGNAVRHHYLMSGTYTITVSIDNICVERYKVNIVERPLGNDELMPVQAIIAPDTIMLGDPIFVTSGAKSQTFTWSVAERNDITPINERDANLYIPDVGIFTIVLKIDNGAIFQKQIIVKGLDNAIVDFPPDGGSDIYIPPPPPSGGGGIGGGEIIEDTVAAPKPVPTTPQPPIKQYDQLPDNTIREMLNGVIDKKKTTEDFNNILCNGATTKVVANGNVTKFSILVEDLSNKKGIKWLKSKHKITSFKVTRDPQNGSCVQVIYIDYK